MFNKLTVVILFALSLTGCVMNSSTRDIALNKEVWWGNKQEIIYYLNSSDAKSEMWFIQGMGEAR